MALCISFRSAILFVTLLSRHIFGFACATNMPEDDPLVQLDHDLNEIRRNGAFQHACKDKPLSSATTLQF